MELIGDAILLGIGFIIGAVSASMLWLAIDESKFEEEGE